MHLPQLSTYSTFLFQYFIANYIEMCIKKGGWENTNVMNLTGYITHCRKK